ncbi:MAG: histone deacetylase [Sedimentisphaerales bacterium]|nr:histone deacetylase [Sedimentisphaerales bacterium]
MPTAFGYDDLFLQHRTGQHPERPARLTAIVELLKREGLYQRLTPVSARVNPDEWINLVHTAEYIERLKDACKNDLPFIDTPDSAICPDSQQVAREAVSLVLAACDMIVAGEAKNAFCAVRPPGHHAENDRSMGFCLYNNAAVAARYLQQKQGLKRILILDFDVHHGNGVQHIFERDNTVFYCSIHQHPATLYPGTGWPDEFGEGPGRGFTLNLPLPPDTEDEDFLDAYQTNFLPMAYDFRPDFMIVCAGFDGHRRDPLAQWNLSEYAYEEITRRIVTFAETFCAGRVLSLLEGGYQLGALAQSVSVHIQQLMAKNE